MTEKRERDETSPMHSRSMAHFTFSLPGRREVTEHEGTIQLFAAATCPKMDMLQLQQHIAESYLLG